MIGRRFDPQITGDGLVAIVRRWRAAERERLRAVTTEARYVYLRDLPRRALLAAWVARPRDVVQHLIACYRVWSAMPGDTFDSFTRNLRFRVVDVRPDYLTLEPIGVPTPAGMRPLDGPMWTTAYYVTRAPAAGAMNVLHPLEIDYVA